MTESWMNKVVDAIWETAKTCDKKCETCKHSGHCIMKISVEDIVFHQKEIEPKINETLKPPPETCCGLEQLDLFGKA